MCNTVNTKNASMKWIREGEERLIHFPSQVRQGEMKFGKTTKWELIGKVVSEVRGGEKSN